MTPASSSPAIITTTTSSSRAAFKSLKGVSAHVLELDEAFWAPVYAHSDWGEPQIEQHTAFNSLFFDLIVVTMALKLNDLLVVGVEENNFVPSAALATSLFAACQSMWGLKAAFDSRLGYDDIAHRGFVFLGNFFFAPVTIFSKKQNLTVRQPARCLH